MVVIDPEEVGQPKPIAETEPNNLARQAQELQHSRRVEGRLNAPAAAEEGDQDWYAVRVVEKGQILQATLSGIDGLDVVLEAFDQKKKRLMKVDNALEGAGEVLVNLFVDEGTYFLLVSEKKRRTSEKSYRLSYQLRPFEEGEEREPNWKKELATPLALDSEILGYLGWHTDTDWYQLETTELSREHRLSVEYDGLDDVRANLSIRMANGAVLQERWGRPGESIILPNIVPPADSASLFVVVRCQHSFNVESRYALRVLAADPADKTETEPNDAPVSATPVELAKPTSGLLVDTIDRDIFSLPVSQPTLVTVRVTPPLQVDVVLSLLDEQGQEIWNIDEGKAREPEIMPTVWIAPPRGLFQVRAARAQFVSAVHPYFFMIEVVTQDAWEHEPNDQPGQATVISWEGNKIGGHIHPKKDVDYFQLGSCEAGAGVTMSKSATCSIKLELMDESGGTVQAEGTSDGQGHFQLIFPQGKSGGSCHFRIREHSGTMSCKDPYWISEYRVNP